MSVFSKWKQIHVDDLQAFGIFDLYRKDGCPKTGGFDTETTGTHIKKDKPFLYQFGWLIPKQEGGRVFTFYPTPENMKVFLKLAKEFLYFFGHNVKFDMHMTANIGYEDEVENYGINWTDNMALARLALEAVPAREGGDNLKLKELGVKYIDPSAANSEGIIKLELKRLNDERVQVLAAALKQFEHPTEKVLKPVRLDTGKPTTTPYATKNPHNVEWKWIPKKWGKGLVEDFLKDPTHDVEDLPEDVREVYANWLEEYPEPTYEDIDREIMLKYGGEDIITMLEFVKKAFPFVKKRNQLPILEIEQKCLLPAYRMERVGLKADLEYLEESRIKVKNYIKELRGRLRVLAKEKVTVGQHDRLKEIFLEKFGVRLESCDKAALKRVMKTYEGEPKEFATIITALRSLEKWYSTYIKRIMDLASYDGNVYTQINLNGAVSGRMSSDFQQFPKSALYTLEKEELYHPRKAFVVKGGGYDAIVYIDYDQIELVTQAHYTLLVSGGDPNLCRAYMPFNCRHYLTGEIFDYKDPKKRARWDELREDFTWDKLHLVDKDDKLDKATAIKYGFSAWIDEDGKPWVKTDVHAETTHNTLMELGYVCKSKYHQYSLPAVAVGSESFPRNIDGEKEFKEVRSKGKLFNFMANYGGGKGAAQKQLDLEDKEADALVSGYGKSFPHVRIYQNKIIAAHRNKGYVSNHYGRRYYLYDPNRAYTLGNYVVQGTCADALKKAIIEIDEYLKDKKTKMVIPVHDEIQFDRHVSEKGIENELMKIMQKAFHWCLVPVTAGVEITYTNWKEKE